MISLFIDTHQSTNLAIFCNKKLVKCISSNELKQSTILMPLLERLLSETNIDINDINEVIVVNGPGSFTGVRLGVTLAKTLAYCNDLTIKCIDSLTIKAISDNFKNKIYAIKDTKGAYVGTLNKDKIECEYILNNDLVALNVVTDVTYDVKNLFDYEKLLIEKPPYLINPLYIKKIEAQK